MKVKESIIPLFKVFMANETPEEVSKVLMSGFIGQGSKVEEFESELKMFFGNEKVVSVNAATSAEHLALHMLKRPADNIKSYFGVAFANSHWDGMELGDEVLTTPLTCTATNWPIVANGFKIKWVDVDPNTCNIDLNDLGVTMQYIQIFSFFH